MGATLSEVFSSAEEGDRWAEEQSRLASRWNLQKTADLGNRPVVRVPVVSPDGSLEEIALPLNTPRPIDERLRSLFAQSSALTGYSEDRSRRRQPAFVRSLRFD